VWNGVLILLIDERNGVMKNIWYSLSDLLVLKCLIFSYLLKPKIIQEIKLGGVGGFVSPRRFESDEARWLGAKVGEIVMQRTQRGATWDSQTEEDTGGGGDGRGVWSKHVSVRRQRILARAAEAIRGVATRALQWAWYRGRKISRMDRWKEEEIKIREEKRRNTRYL
jgi:hypothetical protein